MNMKMTKDREKVINITSKNDKEAKKFNSPSPSSFTSKKSLSPSSSFSSSFSRRQVQPSKRQPLQEQQLKRDIESLLIYINRCPTVSPESHAARIALNALRTAKFGLAASSDRDGDGDDEDEKNDEDADVVPCIIGDDDQEVSMEWEDVGDDDDEEDDSLVVVGNPNMAKYNSKTKNLNDDNDDEDDSLVDVRNPDMTNFNPTTKNLNNKNRNINNTASIYIHNHGIVQDMASFACPLPYTSTKLHSNHNRISVVSSESAKVGVQGFPIEGGIKIDKEVEKVRASAQKLTLINTKLNDGFAATGSEVQELVNVMSTPQHDLGCSHEITTYASSGYRNAKRNISENKPAEKKSKLFEEQMLDDWSQNSEDNVFGKKSISSLLETKPAEKKLELFEEPTCDVWSQNSEDEVFGKKSTSSLSETKPAEKKLKLFEEPMLDECSQNSQDAVFGKKLASSRRTHSPAGLRSIRLAMYASSGYRNARRNIFKNKPAEEESELFEERILDDWSRNSEDNVFGKKLASSRRTNASKLPNEYDDFYGNSVDIFPGPSHGISLSGASGNRDRLVNSPSGEISTASESTNSTISSKCRIPGKKDY